MSLWENVFSSYSRKYRYQISSSSSVMFPVIVEKSIFRSKRSFNSENC